MSHTLIFDIGKTNKKCFLFDENYRVVYQEVVRIEETKDDDGDPCDDLDAIEKWIKSRFKKILNNRKFKVKAVNFSTYGASLVHVDRKGKPLTPLYNYLKPYPENISELFYEKYGDSTQLAKETASPASGMLNSGLQLFWLKQTRPELYRKIRWSIHFPQYLSYLFTGVPLSDYTSVGCHTGLWDYKKGDYHDWVFGEGLDEKLPPLLFADTAILKNFDGNRIRFGIGIHDSSAALLPYILADQQPFVLISTGTWSVSLNPFNESLLTKKELENDCLNYMQINGKAVKASRLFLGNEYHLQVEKLNTYFGKPAGYHKKIKLDKALFLALKKESKPRFHFESIRLKRKQPDQTSLESFQTYEAAYHRLMIELVELQTRSTEQTIGSTKIKRIYIDGGFAENAIFIQLLSGHFSNYTIRTAKSLQGSAFGAAMAVAGKKLKGDFLKKHFGLKKYPPLF